MMIVRTGVSSILVLALDTVNVSMSRMISLTEGERSFRATGSVRARASQYRLNWNETNPGSCGLQDGQHGHTPPEEESAAVGGNVLVVAGMRAEKVAQLIVSATEPGC